MLLRFSSLLCDELDERIDSCFCSTCRSTSSNIRGVVPPCWFASEASPIRSTPRQDLLGHEHETVSHKLQELLASATVLAHPDMTKRFCLHADACDAHWASALTQVEPRDLDLPVPSALLSGSFSGSSFRWAIIEKEAFAIVQSGIRLEHLTARADGISMFTDHRNSRYIFKRVGVSPVLSQHAAPKLLRWALRLLSFRYITEHVPGEENVWADFCHGGHDKSTLFHQRNSLLFDFELRYCHPHWMQIFSGPLSKMLFESKCNSRICDSQTHL
jgi:hypothetical protein